MQGVARFRWPAERSLFFTVDSNYAEMPFLKEIWGTKCFDDAIFPGRCIWSQRFLCFQAETQRQVCPWVSWCCVCGGVLLLFSAGSVLSTGWYHYSRISGRELLQNVSLEPPAPGFESQYHNLLAVWSPVDSTSLGLSGGVPIFQLCLP